jgi:hypothetical protein
MQSARKSGKGTEVIGGCYGRKILLQMVRGIFYKCLKFNREFMFTESRREKTWMDNKVTMNHNTAFERLIVEYSAHKLAAEGCAMNAEFIKKTENLYNNVSSYRLEKYHSEMLQKILDPKTPEIGGVRFLRVFLELLKKINPRIKTGGLNGQITVEREPGGTKTEGRISTIVYYGKHAIIIENKIRNTPEKPNLMARDVRYVRGQGKEIAAVVFIPLYDDNRLQLPLAECDSFWKTYIPEIENKLVILPAVNRRLKDVPDAAANDIAGGFIAECLKLEGITEPQRLMLSRYAEILQTMEGESKMLETVDRELIKEFYTDKKSIETLERVYEIWNDRAWHLGALIRQPIMDKLKNELGFYEQEEYLFHLFKDIGGGVGLVFYADPRENKLRLGFFHEEVINEKTEQALEHALREALSPSCFNYPSEPSFYKHPPIGSTFIDSSYAREFSPDDYNEPLPEMEKFFINCCKALEKALKKALNQKKKYQRKKFR